MPSDLIYREDAKDFVRHAYYKGLNPVEYIDEVPAADVVEVVRCKDCVHRPIVIDVSKPYGYGITGPKENGDTDFTCPYLCDDEYYYNGIMPKDDWYCSKGERRTGNGK